MDVNWSELAGVIGVTLVISRGSIFDDLRHWMTGFSHPMNVLRWVGNLISCPQCTGFWVGCVWGWVSLRDLWLAVLMGGVTSVCSTVADLVLQLVSSWVDAREEGRMDVMKQLLEMREARRREREEREARESYEARVREVRGKVEHGEPLTEDEADMLATHDQE